MKEEYIKIADWMRNLEETEICDLYYKAKAGVWDERIGNEPTEEKKRETEQTIMNVAEWLVGSKALFCYGYEKTTDIPFIKDGEDYIRKLREYQEFHTRVVNFKVY